MVMKDYCSHSCSVLKGKLYKILPSVRVYACHSFHSILLKGFQTIGKLCTSALSKPNKKQKKQKTKTKEKTPKKRPPPHTKTPTPHTPLPTPLHTKQLHSDSRIIVITMYKNNY